MMNVTVVAPTDLRDFLKSAGWVSDDRSLAERLYALQHPSFPRRQLVFPMDSAAPDYVESVASVLSKFSELISQTPSAVAARLHSFKDDVIRIRVSFDGDDSEIPLSFAATVVENTSKMLKAAACTVLRPRIRHPRLTLSEASQFVDKARFGQTETGSFVLRVACPIRAMELQGALMLDSGDVPFVRKVTWSLRQAIAQLVGAIEADRLSELIDEIKQHKAPIISSNLCEAISGLHDDRLDNSIDVGLDWSAQLPVADSALIRTIRIQRDYFSRIEEVRRELRAIETDAAESFVGTVERLDGEMGADGRRSGNVVLALLLRDEGETVRARTMLNAEDYAKADRAHMDGRLLVRVSGLLWPGRQPRQLTELSSFELLNSSTGEVLMNAADGVGVTSR
jgi:hypothetical protein